MQVANAVFLFPVDPTAALSSFRGVKDDGAVLVGVIKEKQEAVRDYDAAVGRGKDAALVSSLGGGDVIVLKVGSLLPQSGITVTLSLVVPLDCPDRHTARFSLPTVIGARYVPKGIPSPFAADAECADAVTSGLMQQAPGQLGMGGIVVEGRGVCVGGGWSYVFYYPPSHWRGVVVVGCRLPARV